MPSLPAGWVCLPGLLVSKPRTKLNNAAIGEYAESAGRLCALASSKRGSKCAVLTSASANEQQDSVRRVGEESSVRAKPDSSRREESAGAFEGLTLEQARVFALDAGFQEAGLVALPYEAAARDAERFREWVAAGRAGTMGYLERKAENGRLLREQTAVPVPVGAVGADLLCQLCISIGTALNQRVKARERLDCAVCVEQSRQREGRAAAERLSQSAAEADSCC